MIDKVVVHEDALELHLLIEKLADHLKTKSGSNEPIHILTSPCKLARRGQDLKFVLPLLDDNNTFSRKDPSLIVAIAKAHLWWDWIKTGEVKTLSEIAQREGLDRPKVTRLLRLALLSPKLVRQIRDGEQPVGVTVKTLTCDHELPHLWEAQETLVASLH